MYLCGARELVSCIAHRVGFGDMECSKIALALDEAMCNVIRHGYNKETNRPIWLTIYPQKPDADSFGGIEIIIEDEAKQINPDNIVGRDLEDIRPGGLGVHIMREVMDEVVFEKRESKGMRLRMSKSDDLCRQWIEQRRDMMAASDNDFVRIENPADGVTVLVPTADIDMSRSPDLRSSIKGELKPGLERMIIDLSEVQYMDSSGLATLVEAMRLAKKEAVGLHLASMTDKVRAIFEIARLDAFFSIKDTRQDALDA
ncbi:unnamed protein product [Symbiodinium sp. CCMP2592]|nr:unnamed protein product [Symbiodinium sp. CCMP2592]